MADNRAAHCEAIVLLHGFGGHPLQMAVLNRRLQRRGFATLNIGYPSWSAPLDRNIGRLHNHIVTFATALDGPVHFVGHSMGGLVARAYLARHRPANLGRLVMLGTPNGGSEIADLVHKLRLGGLVLGGSGDVLCTVRADATHALLGAVDYPLGVIAGNRTLTPPLSARLFDGANDGKVSVAATHVAGETDHIILPVSHTAMVYSTAVADQVSAFLTQGRFIR